jgi:Tfp pilus assembly protein FimV
MRARSIRWLVWLSVSLVLWTATAESTHSHPIRSSAASCSICIAAHSAGLTVGSSQNKPVFAAIGLLQVEELLAKAQGGVLALGIRGPPTV